VHPEVSVTERNQDDQELLDLAVEVIRISKMHTEQSTSEWATYSTAAPKLAQALVVAQEKIAWLKPHVDGLAKVAQGHREGEALATTKMKELRNKLVHAATLLKEEYQRGWSECRAGVQMTLSTYRPSTVSWQAVMAVLEDINKLEKLPHDPPPVVDVPPPVVDVPPPDPSDARASIVAFLRKQAALSSTGRDLLARYADRVESRQDLLPADAAFDHTGDVRKDAAAVDAHLVSVGTQLLTNAVTEKSHE
jgi:hypothetical protein